MICPSCGGRMFRMEKKWVCSDCFYEIHTRRIVWTGIILALIILISFSLSSCGGVDNSYSTLEATRQAEQVEMKEESNYNEKWVGTNIKRVYDPEFGIVCYEDFRNDDTLCFEVER